MRLTRLMRESHERRALVSTRPMSYGSWAACMRLQDKWSMHACAEHACTSCGASVTCLDKADGWWQQTEMSYKADASCQQTSYAVRASRRLLRRPSLSAGTWLWQGGALVVALLWWSGLECKARLSASLLALLPCLLSCFLVSLHCFLVSWTVAVAGRHGNRGEGRAHGKRGEGRGDRGDRGQARGEPTYRIRYRRYRS